LFFVLPYFQPIVKTMFFLVAHFKGVLFLYTFIECTAEAANLQGCLLRYFSASG